MNKANRLGNTFIKHFPRIEFNFLPDSARETQRNSPRSYEFLNISITSLITTE